MRGGSSVATATGPRGVESPRRHHQQRAVRCSLVGGHCNRTSRSRIAAPSPPAARCPLLARRWPLGRGAADRRVRRQRRAGEMAGGGSCSARRARRGGPAGPASAAGGRDGGRRILFGAAGAARRDNAAGAAGTGRPAGPAGAGRATCCRRPQTTPPVPPVPVAPPAPPAPAAPPAAAGRRQRRRWCWFIRRGAPDFQDPTRRPCWSAVEHRVVCWFIRRGAPDFQDPTRRPCWSAVEHRVVCWFIRVTILRWRRRRRAPPFPPAPGSPPSPPAPPSPSFGGAGAAGRHPSHRRLGHHHRRRPHRHHPSLAPGAGRDRRGGVRGCRARARAASAAPSRWHRALDGTDVVASEDVERGLVRHPLRRRVGTGSTRSVFPVGKGVPTDHLARRPGRGWWSSGRHAPCSRWAKVCQRIISLDDRGVAGGVQVDTLRPDSAV